MADNSTQNGTDSIRDKDRVGIKTQIVGLDLGIGTGTESLMSGAMPVTQATAAAFNATVVQGTAANLNATVTGTGTTGAPSAGILTVQGNASGAAVPVSGGSTNSGALSTPFTFTAVDAVVAAPDGIGTIVNGTPTAGSMSSAFTVADGLVASLFLIKGFAASQTTLTLYFEGSRNSTNGTDGDWIDLKQRRTGTQVGVEATDYKTQANGYFRGNCAGFTWLRARILGTFAAGVSVQVSTSSGQGATFLNSGIPTGTSTIGNVGIVAGSAAIGSVTVTSAPTTPVTGTFFQATQPVSLAANTPTLQAGSTTAVTQATAANLNATVVQAAITKGTQGTTGVTTQDLKDAGRAPVSYYVLIPVLTSATDTLQSLTGTKGAATVAATTTPAVVSAGKTFRMQSMWATYISTAVSGFAIVRLRYNAGGVVAITSPVLANVVVGTAAPTTVNATDQETLVLPDGVEVLAGAGVGISVQGFAAATATAVGYVLCGITGYEY